ASQLVVKIGVAKTGVTIDSVFQADPLFEEMRFLPEWRHKKTRLVRSGFYVLPRMEAGTTKTIDG
ncbi:hypothetical protein, partial [Escherichia coli]|uniref:hypothetical protein n=1 Tax=Escherichia coli TaxID=562 RepID=UPI001BC89D33